MWYIWWAAHNVLPFLTGAGNPDLVYGAFTQIFRPSTHLPFLCTPPKTSQTSLSMFLNWSFSKYQRTMTKTQPASWVTPPETITVNQEACIMRTGLSPLKAPVGFIPIWTRATFKGWKVKEQSGAFTEVLHKKQIYQRFYCMWHKWSIND